MGGVRFDGARRAEPRSITMLTASTQSTNSTNGKKIKLPTMTMTPTT